MKMLFIFSALLMFKTGCCTEDEKFVTKTVDVGQNVTLMCPRQKSRFHQETWFWIRFVSGNRPEFLGAAFSYLTDGVASAPDINVNHDKEAFMLHINGTKLSDTGLYYCGRVRNLNMIITNGTFLKIKDTESDITAVIQEAPSDPARPGDPVTLQCSVLSDTERKTCSADPRVFWFRAGSDETHPKLIYTHGNSREECEKSHEADFTQKCVYDFSRNISPSDTGTYICAVATCGEIMFGNGVKLEIEEPKVVLILLCASLSVSLTVTFYLTYATRKDICCYCSDAAAGSSEQHIQQSDEDRWMYSSVIFTLMETESRKMKEAACKQRIYAALKTFSFDQSAH